MSGRNNVLITVVIIVLVIIAGLLLPFLLWANLHENSLNIWVVDKTVPVPDYREHKGLFWILNHKKIKNEKTEDYFRFERDYFGFFPKSREEYAIRGIPDKIEYPDLIYIADTYGVYQDDYLKENLYGTRSDLIYGGLRMDEIANIMQNLGNKNTIIGEFNIASPPTQSDVKHELGRIFGVQWQGWIGRYFPDLSRGKEVPVWLIQNYENQYKKVWNFKGAGIAFVSDQDEVIVLEDDKFAGKQPINIVFSDKNKENFGIKGEIPYRYWFEYINVQPGREVIAEYRLELTEEGKNILKNHGLQTGFPAIVGFTNPTYTSYYFAGDFADYSRADGLWNYYGYDLYKKITTFKNEDNNDYFYWHCYVPIMKKIINDIINIKREHVSLSEEPKEKLETKIKAKAFGRGFEVFANGKWQNIFIKGVNIGTALPGRWYTEFVYDENVYLKWFEQISDMNVNTIRVYTLMPPEFYRALAYFNERKPNSRLWLFQEIWPDDEVEGHDYLEQKYTEKFLKEIENVIDAIHGKASIEPRRGRAYGIYTSDISEYVIGFLVGRELLPEEVIATNENNSDFTFKGEYFSVNSKGSPAEAWLAMTCEHLLNYEEKKYNWQHPVGIVSWPTLDPMEHPSEWNEEGDKTKEYNDKISIDINNIEISEKVKAGFFGAYHIYPNYPDFMNNEISYAAYEDEEGSFRYGGYLQEFMATHNKYPALVAEFGLATGMGNAHTNPDGYNHGGMTEEMQGLGIIRMMKAIKREGYAGGIIFEWMDEWAKKTWITEPFMIPYERHIFWHNIMDPEQNYGILTYEPDRPMKTEVLYTGQGSIKKIVAGHDFAYLYLDIELNSKDDLKDKKLLIGLDTYDRAKGEYKLSPDIDAVLPFGVEFLIEVENNESAIYVHPGYNISKGKYSSYRSSTGIFESITPLVNKAKVTKDGRKIDAIYHDASVLNYGNFTNNSYNNWYIGGNNIHFRLPWNMINFTDPSSLQVLDDQRAIVSPIRDELEVVTTDGIMVAVMIVEKGTNKVIDLKISDDCYIWEEWDQVPDYIERFKSSYKLLKDFLATLK